MMDEFHRINVECLSVMLFEIQAVLLSMRGGLSTCTLEDGKDVSNVLVCECDDHNHATNHVKLLWEVGVWDIPSKLLYSRARGFGFLRRS